MQNVDISGIKNKSGTTTTTTNTSSHTRTTLKNEE